MHPTEIHGVNAAADPTQDAPERRRYLAVAGVFFLLHIFLMLCRYGSLPVAPVLGDEVVINDAAISLARGTGLVARSFSDSQYGFDTVFAHFPPIYLWVQALAFHLFGVSVQSLRLTTTVMSIGESLVLLLLLYGLCRVAVLAWDTAAVVIAIFCSDAALVALERTARMESMIGLLVLLSLWAILSVATRPGRAHAWLLTIVGGVFAALSLAVHPEAISALVLLGALFGFVVPGNRLLRIATLSLFVLVPLGVALATFGSHSGDALAQFVNIFHGARTMEPTTIEWLRDTSHYRSISSLSRVLFLVFLMTLMLLVPVSARPLLRELRASASGSGSFKRRMILCFAAIGIVEFLLLITLFRMNDRRFQFLVGPFLVLNAICLVGNAPLKRWQQFLGWGFVAFQLLAAAVYLGPRTDRLADADPNRYMAVIKSLPPGIPILGSRSLWLDLQESGRSYTLIYPGLDGEEQWAKESANPFERFPVIVLAGTDCVGRPYLRQEASEGRTVKTYRVGTDTVEVYQRPAPVLR
jgi:4-amino-4-deoxy-L-arabinose transferase-like glycosyltransferase